jgi:hypothetical protein
VAYPDVLGEIVRVTVAALYPVGATGQQVQECNICFQCSSAGAGDSRLALAAQVFVTFEGQLRALMAASAKLYGYKCSVLGIYPPPLAVNGVVNEVGTGGATQLPTQARGLISWKTAIGGRTGRGRIYVWTPEDANLDANGNPGAAYIAGLNNIANAVTSGFSAGGSSWVPVIAHRGAGAKPTYTATPVNAHRTSPGWATQRRSGESGRINAAPW